MDFKLFWNNSWMLTWIFVFFFPFGCSGNDAPSLKMENTVFVAFRGEDLSIMCEVNKPANQTVDFLTCFDPSNTKIYNYATAPTAGNPEKEKLSLELKNMTVSGEYYCQYKGAKVFWFLRVRAEGYKEVVMLDYTEMIIMAVVTGVLLVFSVGGSVYVFRGHWKGTKSETAASTQKQNREERREEREEENVDVITAQSTSFYASLETRPRSIYDVLDHSAANRQPEKKNAKAKKKQVQNTVSKSTEKQEDGVVECVYENF